MKIIFLILFLSFSCFAQEKRNNYIISNNFASEAEFYFHENNYDSAVFYYEKAFEYVSEPHPMQRYNYAMALWKLLKYETSLEMVKQSGIYKIDTNWFSGLSTIQYNQLQYEMQKKSNEKEIVKKCSFYNAFMDSIFKIDQIHRIRYHEKIDSMKYIKPYPAKFIDSIEPIWKKIIDYHDSCNAISIIEFTKKYGFPAGVNTCWDQTAATFIIHMSPIWFIENYDLLFKEVVKGNLEPWMLARGIDRMFTVEIGEDKINPFNRYWKESKINPFLMFYNCVSLGVSPYYDFNWIGNPRKTIHFDYYKENKKYYNTTFEFMNYSK